MSAPAPRGGSRAKPTGSGPPYPPQKGPYGKETTKAGRQKSREQKAQDAATKKLKDEEAAAEWLRRLESWVSQAEKHLAKLMSSQRVYGSSAFATELEQFRKCVIQAKRMNDKKPAPKPLNRRIKDLESQRHKLKTQLVAISKLPKLVETFINPPVGRSVKNHSEAGERLVDNFRNLMGDPICQAVFASKIEELESLQEKFMEAKKTFDNANPKQIKPAGTTGRKQASNEGSRLSSARRGQVSHRGPGGASNTTVPSAQAAPPSQQDSEYRSQGRPSTGANHTANSGQPYNVQPNGDLALQQGYAIPSCWNCTLVHDASSPCYPLPVDDPPSLHGYW